MPDRNWTCQVAIVSWKFPACRGFRPPADEPFGIAEGGVPLRRIAHGLVVHHLDHALLILRREHRQDGWRLRDSPDPFGAMIGPPVALVVPIPVGHRRLGVDGRSALGLRRGHQRRVVFLRRLVGVGTQDVLPRPVGVAVAPGSRRRADWGRCGPCSTCRTAGAAHCTGSSACPASSPCPCRSSSS